MIKLPAARLEPAAGVLRRLRADLEAGVQALARTCARSGTLDTAPRLSPLHIRSVRRTSAYGTCVLHHACNKHDKYR